MPLDASGREGQEAEKSGALQEDIFEEETRNGPCFYPSPVAPKSHGQIDFFSAT
jgi:hypothetical protein